jgi:SSS family solute:Na+ symporter
MHEFHFLGAVFALLLAIMALSRWIKPMDQPWEHRHSGDVDLTPWQWAKPMGIGLAVAVLLLYMAFADTSVL